MLKFSVMRRILQYITKETTEVRKPFSSIELIVSHKSLAGVASERP